MGRLRRFPALEDLAERTRLEEQRDLHDRAEITRTASEFSRRTLEFVDDRLAFSATLMRAGEVEAAQRVLSEVEQHVREEQAALAETVNEVRVARAINRPNVTRLKLARMLVAATLGASLLGTSAIGAALAAALADDGDKVMAGGSDGLRPGGSRAGAGAGASRTEASNVRGARPVREERSRYERIIALLGEDPSPARVRSVLATLPPSLAAKVVAALGIDGIEPVAKVAALSEPVREVERDTEGDGAAATEREPRDDDEPAEEQGSLPDGDDDEDRDDEGEDNNALIPLDDDIVTAAEDEPNQSD